MPEANRLSPESGICLAHALTAASRDLASQTPDLNPHARFPISPRRASAGPAPPPTRSAVLNSVFGLPGFRGAQEEIVRHVTDGGNCLVLMPTGGGKSLCYQLPSLLREGCGIVVSPLIALMRDQVAGLLEAGVKAAVLNSTLNFDEAAEVERAAAAPAISTCSMSRRNGC